MPELAAEPVPHSTGGPRTAGPGRALAHDRIRPWEGRFALADGRRVPLAVSGKAAYCTCAAVPRPDGRRHPPRHPADRWSHPPHHPADRRSPDAGAVGNEGSIPDIMRLISAGGG